MQQMIHIQFTRIEDLHMVRTYMQTVLPAPWFPFCIARYGEKQQNMLLFRIYFITGFKFTTKCVY